MRRPFRIAILTGMALLCILTWWFGFFWFNPILWAWNIASYTGQFFGILAALCVLVALSYSFLNWEEIRHSIQTRKKEQVIRQERLKNPPPMETAEYMQLLNRAGTMLGMAQTYAGGHKELAAVAHKVDELIIEEYAKILNKYVNLLIQRAESLSPTFRESQKAGQKKILEKLAVEVLENFNTETGKSTKVITTAKLVELAFMRLKRTKAGAP